MNIVLFVVVLATSFIAVRIGAIAFELTGIEWSHAKFQALSCFTGTGFTTKEAELITGNSRRRRIASVLMVLGNAGFVTLIATFANSLRTDALVSSVITSRFQSVFPWWVPSILNLAAAGLAIYLIFKLFTYERFVSRLTRFLRTRILKRDMFAPATFEELLIATGGYGVSTVAVTEDSPVAEKRLSETDLRARDITILAVEREDDIIANPPADMVIRVGHRLVCFGKLDRIRHEMHV